MLLEIYRSNILLYSSSAPEELLENEEEAPSYDWVFYYEIDFADGPAEAMIYANDMFRWTSHLTIGAVFLSCLVFLFVFLCGCRKIVSYICQLSREIQAMEGGDLDVPFTFRGDHELTQLAKKLDARGGSFFAGRSGFPQEARRISGGTHEASAEKYPPVGCWGGRSAHKRVETRCRTKGAAPQPFRPRGGAL